MAAAAVVRIGPNILGYVLTMRAPPLAAGDRPPNLRPVHSLGRGRARGIDGNGERQSRDNAEHDRAALDPNDEPACFELRGSRFERIVRYPAFDVCFVLAVVSFSLAFISLILRCRVRRLIPSFLAAAVTFPLVVTNACKISLRSVS